MKGYPELWWLEQKLFKVELSLFLFFFLLKSSNTCTDIYARLTLFLPPSQQIKNICAIYFLLFSCQSQPSAFYVYCQQAPQVQKLPGGTCHWNDTSEMICGEKLGALARVPSNSTCDCLW